MVLRRLLALCSLIALGSGTALAWNASTARADGTDGKVAGMTMSTLGQSEGESTAMSAVAADGVNTVSLFVWWLTQGPSSNTISPFDATESDASLTADIAAAHAAGLKVVLTPIFICESCQGGWRGVMEPSNVPAFFASYRAFMNHYAQLAQADNVWLLFIGSEMTSLEGQTAQWQSVISSARQYYSGKIGYEQNWDVVGQPQFLSDVDVIGVSAYYPLDDSADPGEAQLLADWTNSQNATYKGHNWVGGLQHLASSTGKPILFGEVGYMASDYAASQPFDNNDIDTNQTLQANLYQALLTTFSGYSWWMGVTWWEWSDATGDDRTPRGRAAETLLRNWYLNGWRPTSGSSSGSASGSGSGTGVTGSGVMGSGLTGAGAAGAAGAGGAAAGSTAGSSAAPASSGGASPGSTNRGSGTTSGPSAPSGNNGAATASSSGSTLAGSTVAGSKSSGARTSGGGATTTDPTIAPGQPFPLSSGPQAVGRPASSGVVVRTVTGDRPAVLALSALALVALAGTAAAVPVIGFGPQLADRRRRPTLYADFD